LQKLEQLDLSFNSLEGPLTPSWASMTSLKQLWLDVNKLTGPLPASWAGMAALEKLVLSENSLSGALPPAWSGMASLKELWLEYNEVSRFELLDFEGFRSCTYCMFLGFGGGAPACQLGWHDVS
jgi:hypothetical protein